MLLYDLGRGYFLFIVSLLKFIAYQTKWGQITAKIYNNYQEMRIKYCLFYTRAEMNDGAIPIESVLYCCLVKKDSLFSTKAADFRKVETISHWKIIWPTNQFAANKSNSSANWKTIDKINWIQWKTLIKSVDNSFWGQFEALSLNCFQIINRKWDEWRSVSPLPSSE